MAYQMPIIMNYQTPIIMNYQTRIHNFLEATTLKVRYQNLEINNGEAQRFADVVLHEFLSEEYNMSLAQVISRLRSSSKYFWISGIKINNHIVSCTATAAFHNIRQFKALALKQEAEAASDDAVVVTQNDLTSISNIKDLVSVALRICPSLETESPAEYAPSFEYHVVEDAILMTNGWECLRLIEDRYQSIEDNEWLTEQKDKLFKQFPWLCIFNVQSSLLEYSIKLMTKTADAKGSNQARRKMLTKALRGRIKWVANKNTDLGHAFCIAVLMTAIYHFSDDTI